PPCATNLLPRSTRAEEQRNGGAEEQAHPLLLRPSAPPPSAGGIVGWMSVTTEISEARVLEALRTVKFPGLTRDIVSFGFVKELAVGGGNVSFRLEITTDPPRAAEEIKRDATEKLRSLPGVNAVTIRMDTQQPGPAAPRGAFGTVPPP